MATYYDEVVSGRGVSLTISGGDLAYNTTVRNSASLRVNSGGYVETTTVYNNATLINSGGIASLTYLSGGTMTLSRGGSAEVVSVLRNARLTVVSGAVATGVTVVSGGNVNATVYGNDGITRIEGTNELGSFFLSDGVAANFLLNNNGQLVVQSGGTAQNTTIRTGGALTVSTGGVATGIVQSHGGKLNTYLRGGDALTKVVGSNDYGTFLLSDGVASGFVLYENAAQYVSNGGTALNTIVSSNWAHQYVSFGGVASATSVCNKGSMTVYGGGVAKDTVVYAGGSMMPTGGEVDKVTVYGELLVTSATSGQEESGGAIARLHNVAIMSGGVMKVTQNAEFGGVISLNGKVELTDSMTILDGASLVFDVTERYDSDGAIIATAIIDDWNKVHAVLGATYSVSASVGDTPVVGSYKLAGNAAAFDKTITVNSGTTELGTLSVGGSFTEALFRYSLAVDDASALLLTIENIPPQIQYFGGDGARWDPGVSGYVAVLSNDGFEKTIRFAVSQPGIDFYNLDLGEYDFKVRTESGITYSDVAETTVENTETGAVRFVADNDGVADAFFAQSDEVWRSGYYARHVGTSGWAAGTGEMVVLQGKNRIANVFNGSDDASVLFLSDSDNGDALELDDIFTALPDGESEPIARFSQIGEVRAGAGNDIVDLTSTKFPVDGMILRGGDGDDVLWSGDGNNLLFGDAGDDRLVGGAGADVLCGGIGDDRMHGGGGDDIFTFAGDWGKDTVKQTDDGSVTLWFADLTAEDVTISDIMGNTVISHGNDTVTVMGRDAGAVDLRFGAGGDEPLFDELAAQGAFADYSSAKIFEDKNSISVIVSLK